MIAADDKSDGMSHVRMKIKTVKSDDDNVRGSFGAFKSYYLMGRTSHLANAST